MYVCTDAYPYVPVDIYLCGTCLRTYSAHILPRKLTTMCAPSSWQTHLAFSPQYAGAVEAKQVAQQEAETAKYLVEKALEEKKSIVISAQVSLPQP